LQDESYKKFLLAKQREVELLQVNGSGSSGTGGSSGRAAEQTSSHGPAETAAVVDKRVGMDLEYVLK
jgi:hypothetical protein